MLFLFETPENKGFKEKIGSKFDTTKCLFEDEK